MTTEAQTPAEMNAEAVRILKKLEAERAEQAEQSKRNMGLGTTLRITGKTRPENVDMGKKFRAVIWTREEE